MPQPRTGGATRWMILGTQRDTYACIILSGMLSCTAAGIVMMRSAIAAPVTLAWVTGYLLLLCWWARAVLRDSKACFAGQSRTLGHRLTLAVGTAVHGLMWGMPPLLLGAEMSPTDLQQYYWLACAASIAMATGLMATAIVVHIFLSALLVPLALAWIAKRMEQGLIICAVVSVTWILALLINRRVMSIARRAQLVARHKDAVAARLSGANRLLKEANGTKTRALQVASHEIRQPVHAIGLLLEHLRMQPAARSLRSQVDEIASVVQSVSSALELLLNLSLLDAGNVRVQVSPIAVNEFLLRVHTEFESSAKKKGLKLQFRPADSLVLSTDPVLLHSIVANLVSNAIRYTEVGSVTVSCSYRSEQEIWIHVVDTGIGIPQERHQDIFDDYVRLDRENQATQGFGLGLAIVRRTAALLGLSVELASEPGRGSRFSVSVPLAAAADQNRLTAASGIYPTTVGRNLVGLKGLLVDNDLVVLRAMEHMLHSWGCRTMIATHYEDLRKKLTHTREPQFDFMIADYHLGIGSLDGLEAIRLVRRSCQHPVAASLLTGDLHAKIDPDFEGGPVQLLHKPVSPHKLRASIESMVQHPPSQTS